MAAAYFLSLVKKEGLSVTVRSAGLEMSPEKAAHSDMKALARLQQLSLDSHTSTQIHPDLLSRSDLILVMEISHKDRIQRLYPAHKGKVLLLGAFDAAGSLEIADPYGRPLEDFRIGFEQIKRCCNGLIEQLAREKVHNG